MIPEIININLLVIGFMGGVFRLAMEPKPPTPWEVVRYIAAGGLAANFFVTFSLLIIATVPPILAQIQIPEALVHATPWTVAFWIGMGGLRIGRWADRQLARWLKHIERMKNE